MERTINRQTVLKHTLWGADIYCHILRKFYPGETVMHVSGRDCGTVRNPYAGGKRTLQVRIDRLHPEQRLSDECARHHDLSGTIPDGDALDFASMFYHQTGQELLTTLNREMNLHLDGENRQYKDIPPLPTSKGPRFSFFKAPITNTRPYKSITILDARNYITGHYARDRTRELRSIMDKSRARIFKSANFDYATFSGEFSIRNNAHCLAESGLLCLDFDHVPDVEGLFARLLTDRYFETALLFRSPSGDGLKWIIEVNRGQTSHPDYFCAVTGYITRTYGIEPDKSGKDLARACFLPHDQNAYINPNYR